MTLSTADFIVFHRFVHGYAPFPWQIRLLDRVITDQAWPRVLDLPTGAGKTTCIDIALFVLALNAEEPPDRRWCPRRIAMIVDRRVVVDQAAERGRKLARALSAADDRPDVVNEVTRRLRQLAPNAEEPIGVFTLRGGIPKDDAWARSPDQPLILASTVDQIGSRLLMQGYGVSVSMRPVHAGLLANDVLVLLDEAHLSEPFAETLEQLHKLRARFEHSGLPKRIQFASLSATPIGSREAPFQLNDDDKSAEGPLGDRLHASKPTRLFKVEGRPELEKKSVSEARRLLEMHDTVLVVVNRVASASRIAHELRESLGDGAGVRLLTGRMRPLDRDDVLRHLRPRIMTGRDRAQNPRKFVVVSTQSIEAGADFDFDAIVTEAASLDALRQRFGRVDRLGTYRNAEGSIIVDSSNRDDHVYGSAIARTMSWLTAQATKRTKQVDFGVLALPRPDASEVTDLLPPPQHAPVLLPAYLDLWAQSSPLPAAVPDITLWLHGQDTAPSDVQVVWRADLNEEDLAAARDDDRRREDLIERVSAITPSSLEALSLPIGAARRWLGKQSADDVQDVEGSRNELRAQEEPVWATELAFRWSGDESAVITAEGLRPGDTIVVPVARGGLRYGSFEPAATEPVQDLGERAALLGRGRPVLRLKRDVLRGLALDESLSDADEARAAARSLAAAEPILWRRLWLDRLAHARRQFAVPDSEGDTYVVLEGKRLPASSIRELLVHEHDAEEGGDVSTEPDLSPFIGRSMPLADHSRNVERWARMFAETLGFSENVVNDIVLSAWLHDIGKADRRFQLMLRAGSEIEFLKDETPWAKSGMASGARYEHRLAQQRSGYPANARHEVQSVAMLESSGPTFDRMAIDRDLVLHLVGSHHGFCRPLAPVLIDESDVDVVLTGHVSECFGSADFSATSKHNLYRVDATLADRFWRLIEKYGWLEVCWLEAILRLADHRASEEEQQGSVEA